MGWTPLRRNSGVFHKIPIEKLNPNFGGPKFAQDSPDFLGPHRNQGQILPNSRADRVFNKKKESDPEEECPDKAKSCGKAMRTSPLFMGG